jgi:hypothetical protein
MTLPHCPVVLGLLSGIPLLPAQQPATPGQNRSLEAVIHQSDLVIKPSIQKTGVQDGLALFHGILQHLIETVTNVGTNYSKPSPPASLVPCRPLSAHTGTCRNNNYYYGQVEISEHRGSLWMHLPGKGTLDILPARSEIALPTYTKASSGLDTEHRVPVERYTTRAD